MDYKYSVVIGRFQPFHNDHLKIVKHGLATSEKVIVVIGSSGASPSTRNPFTLKERAMMIRDSFPSHERAKVIIEHVRDYYYNNNAWLADVQAKTSKWIDSNDSVQILGSYKDSSSHYLRMFPQWEFNPVKTGDLNSTDIRKSLLEWDTRTNWEGKPGNFPEDHEFNELILGRVPTPVCEFLREWTKTSTTYASLCKEYKFQRDYRKSWEAAPFPPTFVTADAIVVCSGHVLVIERKINPGKGLFAIPGGFVRQNEFLENASVRELREETGLKLHTGYITDSHVFDYPTRSERGRTITHGFYFKLPDGALPTVKGGDDAKRAFWMPIFDAMKNEEKFFEDHLHIINYFVGAQGER